MTPTTRARSAQTKSPHIGGSEHAEQCALFAWAERARVTHPELALLYAIPNAGKRSPVMGARMRREGLRAGFPDIGLPVARRGHSALFIELKHGKGRPTAQQAEWQALLNAHGNLAVTCWGWDSARTTLLEYLTL